MGGKGQNAKNLIQDNQGIMALKAQPGALADPKVLQALSDYSSGAASLQDSLRSLSSAGGTVDPAKRAAIQSEIDKIKADQAVTEKAPNFSLTDHFAEGKRAAKLNTLKDALAAKEQELKELDASPVYGSRAARDALFTDPLTGTKVATEQVQGNPLLSGVFGNGGLQDRMLTEEQDLAKRGYQLQPEDFEAYGQASDETARLFGEEEGQLAQALASRGLASGASGAAGVAYSGLQGNKLERLAASQRKIAQDRMEMNRQRLNDVRGLSLDTNRLAQAAIGDQYGRNREGVQDYQSTLKNAASAGQAEQGQENTAFEQRVATQGPGLGDIIGGVGSSLLGSAAGSLGKAVGGGLGDKIIPKK